MDSKPAPKMRLVSLVMIYLSYGEEFDNYSQTQKIQNISSYLKINLSHKNKSYNSSIQTFHNLKNNNPDHKYNPN